MLASSIQKLTWEREKRKRKEWRLEKKGGEREMQTQLPFFLSTLAFVVQMMATLIIIKNLPPPKDLWSLKAIGTQNFMRLLNTTLGSGGSLHTIQSNGLLIKGLVKD